MPEAEAGRGDSADFKCISFLACQFCPIYIGTTMHCSTYAILYKKLEHLQILVSAGVLDPKLHDTKGRLQLYFGGVKVKLYVDFRLHRGSVPLIFMLFKGHLYCFQHLSHQVQEEPLTSASSPTKWVTGFSGILREWPSFTKQGPMFSLFNE